MEPFFHSLRERWTFAPDRRSGWPGQDEGEQVNRDELVFSVEGTIATPAVPITLTEAGLREREHLQEWVLAHPELLGADAPTTAEEALAVEGTSSSQDSKGNACGLFPGYQHGSCQSKGRPRGHGQCPGTVLRYPKFRRLLVDKNVRRSGLLPTQR